MLSSRRPPLPPWTRPTVNLIHHPHTPVLPSTLVLNYLSRYLSIFVLLPCPRDTSSSCCCRRCPCPRPSPSRTSTSSTSPLLTPPSLFPPSPLHLAAHAIAIGPCPVFFSFGTWLSCSTRSELVAELARAQSASNDASTAAQARRKSEGLISDIGIPVCSISLYASSDMSDSFSVLLCSGDVLVFGRISRLRTSQDRQALRHRTSRARIRQACRQGHANS